MFLSAATLYEASQTIPRMLIEHCRQFDPLNAETKGQSFYAPGSWSRLCDINPSLPASIGEKIFHSDILHKKFSLVEELLNVLPDIDPCRLRD